MDWLKLAGDNDQLRNGMDRLFRLFNEAPLLGSLIDPGAFEPDLLEAPPHELQPLLESALVRETTDDTVHELAITARGLAKAGEILAGHFMLVATNVPFKGTKQLVAPLQNYINDHYPGGRVNLATAFVLRIRRLLAEIGRAHV